MTVEINGFCEPEFEKLIETFLQNFEDGLEVGASCAVTVNGKYVVDVWAGHKDAAKTLPWKEDTLVNVYSSTKVMVALCVHMLVDRGLIDLEQPVAKYWPEFAQNGKEKLPVKYLLSHSSGLAGWDTPLTLEDLYDWDKVTGLLAAQKPWWEPGTVSGYQVWTHGYLLGEVVRRVSGKSLGTFFSDELDGPIGADFYIGLPEEHDNRVAQLIPHTIQEGVQPLRIEPGSILMRAAINPRADPEQSHIVTRGWLGAEIPAANGQGNARSMARIGSVVANGGSLDGREFLSAETIEKSIMEQIYETDLIYGPIRWGLGWVLPCKEIPFTPNWKNRRACMWGGAGGSIILMDLDAKVCFAYAMNGYVRSLRPWKDPRNSRLRKVLYECLGEDM
jgi:CubicO group peptidase (beta-lactamase class C family)